MIAPDRFVWVMPDPDRGLALVTGRGHDDLVRQVAPDARWSRSRGGWVISMQEVADLCCVCDVERVPYRERVLS